MSAKIFVFIPVYNAEKFLSQAIESVLSQTYSDWDMLLLDDCSTDDSFKIAMRYAESDSRIMAVRNSSNLGMLLNWNKGLTFGEDDFLVKLDADDYWHPHMLEKSMEVLNRFPEVGLVFSKYCNVNEAGEVLGGSEIIFPEFAKDKSFSTLSLVQMGADKMLSFPVLRQGVSVMRKSVVEFVGPYRQLITPETQAATDTEFYFRVGCHYRIHCLDQLYYYYRIHSDSISSEDKRKQLGEKKMFELKSVIYDYYFAQKKISQSEWQRNKRIIGLSHSFFLSYHYRKNMRIVKFIIVMLKLLISSPISALKFYISRLTKRAWIVR